MASAEGHRRRKGFCKAVWEEGDVDSDGQQISHSFTIPRDWVLKDSHVVHWPLSYGKSAMAMIKRCTPRPTTQEEKKKWRTYKLLHTSETYDTWKEADDIKTTAAEQNDLGESSDDIYSADDEAQNTDKNRNRKKLDIGKDFTGGSELDKDSTRSSQDSAGPTRKISSKLGDMSGSQSKLPIAPVRSKGALKERIIAPSKHTVLTKKPSLECDEGDLSSDPEEPLQLTPHRLTKKSTGKSPKSPAVQSPFPSMGDLDDDEEEYAASASVKLLLVNMATDIKVSIV